MSKGIGRLMQMGVAKETSRGTPEAAATYWIPFSEAAVDERRDFVTEDQSRGVIEGSAGERLVKKFVEASVKAPIGDRHFGLVLLAALGSVNSAAHSGETIVYDHTFSVNESAQHQALSLFLDDPLGGADYKHGLGTVKSLEIKYERGRMIDYALSLLAKTGTSATLTPSTVTENLFLPQHATFKLATNLAGLSAASATVIRSLSLKIEKNIEHDDVLGNVEPSDFLNKQFVISGELEATWQNESDFKTAFLAGTQKALRIQLQDTATTLGTASNPTLTIDLAKVIFGELTRPISVNNVIMQRLQFKAHYSISDTKMVQAVLTNLVATY